MKTRHQSLQIDNSKQKKMDKSNSLVNLKKYLSLTILIISSFFLVYEGHAISQVGPKSVGSREESFTLRLPMAYPIYRQLSRVNIEVSDRVISAQDRTPPSYYFLPLRQFSDEKIFSKEDMQNLVKDGNWLEVLTEDCRKSYIQMNENNVIGLSGWGNGKGLVVIGKKTKMVQRNIMTMIQDIQTQNEDCEWTP
jgi:hypothetical protein